jgi:photosystem II stability/assembly factor-like uncharacterized protein
LIDEREVSERFHEALDAQPGPGAFDRLQSALTQRPVTPSRWTTLVLPVPRIGLRLAAAGMIVVLLTLAVAGAFLALRLTASRTAPAGPSTTTTLSGQLYDGWPRMVTPTTGWVLVPPSLDSPSPTRFFRTTDGGATWRSANPPKVSDAAFSVRAWYFLDADHAWIAAAVSSTSLTVFATADGGLTWTAGAPVPPGYEPGGRLGAGATKLDFLDDRVGWLRTSSAPGRHTLKLYNTTDGGRTWHLILKAADSDGSTLAKLGHGCFEEDLKFVSANLGWISYDCILPQPPGQPGSGSPAPGPEVAVTKDGGRTWQQVILPRYTTGDNLCATTAPIFYSSGQVILSGFCNGGSQVTGGVYVGPATGDTAIYVTSDAGLSWSLRRKPTAGEVPAFTDADTGWLMRFDDIFRTFDGGLTWKLTGSIPVEARNALLSFQFFDSNVAIVTSVGNHGLLTIWGTTDGGQTWALTKVPVHLLD